MLTLVARQLRRYCGGYQRTTGILVVERTPFFRNALRFHVDVNEDLVSFLLSNTVDSKEAIATYILF